MKKSAPNIWLFQIKAVILQSTSRSDAIVAKKRASERGSRSLAE